MDITRTVVPDPDDGDSIILTPTEPHPWLDSVLVVASKDTDTLVSIVVKDDAPQCDHRLEKLSGLKSLLEKGAMFVSDKVQGMSELLENRASQVDFKAGPTSKIDSVLRQADLPAEIEKAVMQEVQNMRKRGG